MQTCDTRPPLPRLAIHMNGTFDLVAVRYFGYFARLTYLCVRRIASQSSDARLALSGTRLRQLNALSLGGFTPCDSPLHARAARAQSVRCSDERCMKARAPITGDVAMVDYGHLQVITERESAGTLRKNH